MDRSRPNVFHRGAAAFLACFQALTLLGRNRDSGAKLSVGIHTVSVAEKAKYRLVICHNKKKRRTAWKKVATHDWDFTAEFADSVPEEKRRVRVELQRKKKCKVKTIGVTTLEPTRALQEDGPVLVKDWYVFDPPKKGRQDKNVSLLEATVAVRGLGVERKTTQETGSTPPSKENAKPEVRPESSAELKARDATAEATCQAAGAEKLDTSVQDKLPAPSSGDNTECRPASTGATSGSPSSTTTNGAGDAKPSRIRTLFGFVAKKKSETIKSTDEGGSTKSPDKTNEEKGVTEDGPKNSLEQKESKTTSQTTEGETEVDKSGRDEPASPSSGHSAHCKPAATAPNGSTTASPSSTSTTQTLANGEGDVRPGRIYKLFGFIARKGDGTTKSAQGEGSTKSSDKTNEEKVVTEDGPKNSLEQKESKTTSLTTEGETELDKSGRDEPTSPSSGDSAHCKPAATAPNGSTTASPSSTSTTTQTPANGEGDVRPGRIYKLFGFITKKEGGTTKSTQAEAEASNATNEETVPTEGQLKSSSDKESQLAQKSVSQTDEEEKPGKTDQDKPAVPPCGCVECTKLKPATSSTNSSTSLSPTSSATDKSLTNGDGDAGHAKPKSERPSRFRQLVSFMKKKDNSKATADQPPPQFTDPLCLDMMSCIRELWEDLIPKRAYSKELFDYANTLMSKLEAAAPHTKENTILKNLFAKVPDYTHYELPEMEGLSLQELNQIHKTTECLLDEEDKRATFIRRWLIDDICRVALEEAPKVLESTGPP
ncbi:7 transmembrane receptor (Secretin) [Branchiostoma belcheri]|nr:7 transmembrane receptor (Secretin) [Branchiostoma belcheri]